MKTGKYCLIFFFILFRSIIVEAQDLPFINGKVVYEVDLPFNNQSKQEIFEKSVSFINEVLTKHHFVIKSSDVNTGEIFTSGVTALSDKDRKGFVWDIGEASRLKFDYKIFVGENTSKVIIDNITIIKLDVNKELSKQFEDDIMEEKRAIQSFKDGRLKRSREKRYSTIANNVNETFYSMIAIYKRYIENK